MTSFRTQLLEKFDFSHQEEWPKWRWGFECFLMKEEEENQINTLICAMGDSADDILTSFKLTTTQLKQYHTIEMKVWWAFCALPKCYFWASKVQLAPQEDGETVDTFSTALCAGTKYCNYRTLKDEMIQDQIVVGLQDQRLTEKLQLDP